MIVRGMRLTGLNADGAPTGETTWLPLNDCRVNLEMPEGETGGGRNWERYRTLFAEVDWTIVDWPPASARPSTSFAIMNRPDASSPDTSQPYPLDALIDQIDELTT